MTLVTLFALTPLTQLPLALPPLRHLLLGLLLAVSGFSASASEPREYSGLPARDTQSLQPSGTIPEGQDSPTLSPTGSVPEPAYCLLGACAGCIVLLHRRRSGPGNLRSAPSSALPSGRTVKSHSNRAPVHRRPVDSHRLIGKCSTGRASLRPLRAS